MITKSKYSPFVRYYFIHDIKNNCFFSKSVHYGYNAQNEGVFEARFVRNLEDATGLTWLEACAEMAKLLTKPHVFGGQVKAEDGNLFIERFPELITEEDYKKLKGEI